MKVAIDISPLSSGHKVRGVGFYLQNLKDSLVKYFPDNEYFFFDNLSKIPKDISLIHYPYFEPFFFSLPFVKNRKIVVTVHDLTPIVFKEHFPVGVRGNLKWQIQKKILRGVDGIITDSESSKKDVEKIVGIVPSKIHVVYLAGSDNFKKLKDEKDSSQVFKKFKIPKDFILYVGDVTWNKNLPRIVAAVKGANCTLVMVGKAIKNKDFDPKNYWNRDLVKVQEEIAGDPRFILLGFVSSEDLNYLYNQAKCLLMPSIYEGFGLPVVEAMQAGCPVITSESSSLKEVGGGAVLYVDPMSTISIKDGIEKILKDESLRSDLSKKGLDRAKQFSWKMTAWETLKVYEKVLE